MQETQQYKELLERFTNCLNRKSFNIHSPCVFQITKSPPERLKFALDIEGVKYYELKEKTKVLLEQEDLKRCIEIEEKHRSKGYFFQEFEQGELTKTLYEVFKEDTKMFTIDNIPTELSNMLENKLMEIKQGLLIEHTDYDNDTFSISVAEKMLTTKEKEQFVDAYIESFISTYGTNSQFKVDPALESNLYDYKKAIAEHKFFDKLLEIVKEETKKEVSAKTNMDKYFETYRNNCLVNLENLKENRCIYPELEEAYNVVENLQYSPYEYACYSLNEYPPTFDKDERDTAIEFVKTDIVQTKEVINCTK